MPHRSGSSLQRRERAAPPSPRDRIQHHATAGARRTDYTLLHAGRQVRLGPVAFWIVVGTLVIMAGWTVTTATYFAFREDVLTRLIARETEMQYGYEDRIADLRAKVDRLSSRQLLDQEQYERRLDEMLRRQAKLEQHGSALSSLPDGTITGSIAAPARKEPARSLKPSPINDNGPIIIPGERDARLVPSVRPATAGSLDGKLARLQASLDRVESRQSTAVNAISASYDAKAERMRTVLAAVGVKPSGFAAAGRAADVGGPFVPARAPAHADAFERQLYHASISRLEVDRLSRTVASVPLRKPITGELDVSSPFGVRVDPFGHGAAMHTGVDFRGTSGDPVRATASGTVKTAGWSGGYGNMVEIDHGNGLSTRYGHLSSIIAHVGQTVKVGQVVGRIGSTGRSTGPHLHYETRVNGEAVDPQRFLRAGARLGAIN